MAILDFNTGIQMGLYGDTAAVDGKGVLTKSRIGHHVLEGFVVDRVNHRDEVAVLKWTDRNEVWISWYMWQPEKDPHPSRDERPVITLSGTDSNGDLVQWGVIDGLIEDSGRQARVSLYPAGVDNSSTTGFTDIITGIDLMPANAVRSRVDLHVKLDNVNGEVQVYINQALVGEFLGDTILNPDLTTVNKAHFGMLGNYRNGLVDYDNDCTFSAAFAADEDTVPITMVQSAITGNGTEQDMIGDYTDINLLGDWDDATNIRSDATEQTSTFDKDAVPIQYQSGYDLIAVGVNTRSAVGDAQTINNISHVIDDGLNTVEGPLIALDDLFQPRKTIYHTAADGGAWTASKLDSTQIGVRSKA